MEMKKLPWGSIVINTGTSKLANNIIIDETINMC